MIYAYTYLYIDINTVNYISNLIVEACTWCGILAYTFFMWCSEFQDVSVDYIS